MFAAGNGEIRAIQALLAHQDSPNATDADGQTPLMYAARYGQSEATAALLQAGAKVDVADSQGRTALMYAAENGHARETTRRSCLRSFAFAMGDTSSAAILRGNPS